MREKKKAQVVSEIPANTNKYFALKRLLDVIFSLILILMLALPMGVIWCAVALSSRGGGIFRQVRIGKGGKRFVCYKFRTMYISAPKSCPAAKLDAARFVTPVGKFLRRSSLDELPQLFNVLKGDMSLVGPRPLIIEETDVHKSRERLGIYALRPGITGLSQIRGRNNLSDGEKVAFDAKYFEEFGILQDARILGETVVRVIRGEDVDAGG